MPSLMYVNAALNVSALDAQELNLDRYRKPMWLDFANPVCLDLLKRLAQACDSLVFREALPGPDAHWLEDNGERYVSELQFEIFVTRTEDIQSPTKQGEAA